MPDLLKIAVLAVVQGLTEFLPVSSSGHLVLVQRWLGIESPGPDLEIVLHVGTLISVLAYYHRRAGALLGGMWRAGAERTEVVAIVVAMVPTAAGYFLFHDWIERAFESPLAVCAMLGVTGLTLLSLRFHGPPERPLDLWRALLVGAAQSVAMFPGISRSGATIVAGRHSGLAPAMAAEFSLLLSVPAVAGAVVLRAGEIAGQGTPWLTPAAMVVGVAVSAVIGYGAIALLVRVLSRARLWLFGVYCLALSVAGPALLR